MKIYDYILLGASAVSCGFLCQSQVNDVLVIDRVSIVAKEFCACAKFNRLDLNLQSDEEKRLFEELKKHNLCDDGGNVQIIGVGGVMSKYLLGEKTDVLFETEVTEITRENSLFKVTYFNTDGFDYAYAKRIIDTVSLENQSYTCFAAAIFDKVKPNAVCDFLHKGYFETEYYYLYKTDKEISDARRDIREFWESNIADGFNLVVVCSEMRYDRSGEINIFEKDGITYCPSAIFDNLTAAFKAGSSIYKKLGGIQ